MSSTPDAVPARLVAALGDKYRIERELGAGGSATVYLAEDLKHHRHVAIKVLKPQLAAALGPERFEDEVRIAANLHHPHILAVHDSGEADGFLYYVMPYVDGHSLRDRLDEGLLPFPKVAKILAEVADALAYAHAAGIVHRDIKPENILHNGKHIVVTDFGIAKAISDAAERKSSTSMGIALGTPAYMAPEQAASDPSLDHRADIYSLGVVGYELLVGHPPFSGSAQQILSSHLTTKPEPIQSLREAVPPALANVVMRALAKAPGDRWPSAEAMQAQLEPLAGTTSNSGMVATVTLAAGRRRPTRMLVLAGVAVLALAFGAYGWQRMHTAAAPPAVASTAQATPGAAPAAPADPNAIPGLATDRSIAVLPFVNMSSDKEQEYFADGISEELLNRLAKVQGLRVVARTSSFSFKGKNADIATIAAALKVTHLLEGSVRRSGNKLRISAKLVRAADGGELWSETYDRELADIFTMQDEIAGSVVGELRLKLLGNAKAPKRVNPEAYALYLQGRQVRFQRSRAALEQSLALLKRALELDPGMADAWAELSLMYRNQADAGLRPNGEGYRLAREAADKALTLEPDLTAAHLQLASIAQGNLDLAAAAAHLSRAAATAPDDPDVFFAASRIAKSLGRLDASIAFAEALVARDPQSAAAYAVLGAAYYYAGRIDESLAAGLQLTKLAPNFITGHDGLSDIFAAKGQYEAALAEAKLEEGTTWRQIALAKAYHYLGRKAESDAALDKAIHDSPKDAPFNIAYVYAVRGEKDRAFEWLERAVNERDPGLADIARLPYFASLHDDPRWLPFLRRNGFAPEQLAAIKFDVPVPSKVP